MCDRFILNALFGTSHLLHLSEVAYRINIIKQGVQDIIVTNSTESRELTCFIWCTWDLCENRFGYLSNAYTGIPVGVVNVRNNACFPYRTNSQCNLYTVEKTDKPICNIHA